ncbi:DUF4878 domain-containing protein [Mycolicibacterium baixiangningiae]|uniref:DUF4878 domain-containing protein n=1 Tax=Mycolicibacterium baixiangningiae TaxID=2761578 RepID=UPI0018663F70|nr:DUF4878 domain-containing protein [Mycolicibacterium baixiangningiae]
MTAGIVALVATLVVVFSRESSSTTAGDAVRGYLEALSRGDAEGALSYAINQPADRTFLTDEVLKKQIEANPISDVQIIDSTPEGDVHVLATFGDEAIDEQLRLKQSADGTWKLEYATYAIDFERDKVSSGTSLIDTTTLFGKPLPESGRANLFPGIVDIGNSNPNVDTELIGAVPLLGSTMQNGSAVVDYGFEFTDAGLKEAEKPILALMAECSKSRQLAPPDCPQSYMHNPFLIDGTATWTPPTNTDEVIASDLGPDGTFTVSGSVDFRLSAQATNPRLSVQDQTVTVPIQGVGNLAVTPATFELKKG